MQIITSLSFLGLQSEFNATLDTLVRLYLKIKVKLKKTWRYRSVVEHLFSRHKDWCPILRTHTQKAYVHIYKLIRDFNDNYNNSFSLISTNIWKRFGKWMNFPSAICLFKSNFWFSGKRKVKSCVRGIFLIQI